MQEEKDVKQAWQTNYIFYLSSARQYDHLDTLNLKPIKEKENQQKHIEPLVKAKDSSLRINANDK